MECTWIRSRRATIQASRTNAAKSAPLEERIVGIGLLRLFFARLNTMNSVPVRKN